MQRRAAAWCVAGRGQIRLDLPTMDTDWALQGGSRDLNGNSDVLASLCIATSSEHEQTLRYTPPVSSERM